MKQILLLFALFFAIVVNAQNSKTVSVRPNSQNSQNNKKDNSSAQVDAINQRADALINDIEALYRKYDTMNDKWFQDKKKTKGKMDEVKGQQTTQQNRIKEANNNIENIKEKMKWIDELRVYYENGTLDDLYKGDALHPCANVTTLHLHMQLLGKNYPKKLDDLLLMAECANLVKEEYNATRNNDYRNRLGKMTECDTKWVIDGLLAVHGEIKEEVNKWGGHTLMDMMTFRKYLMNEYGVELDTDFPFLAEQARKKVELPKK